MVALIGSHGTGKTTLLKKIEEYHYGDDLPVISDGDSRTVQNFNIEIGGKLSDREQQILINRMSDARWHEQIRTKHLFQTRSPLDHYAYCEALGWKDLAKERLEFFKASDWKKVQFFYLPIEFELEDDGVRYSGLDFQLEIDETLLSLIKELDIPVTVLTGSIEQRAVKLFKNLKRGI